MPEQDPTDPTPKPPAEPEDTEPKTYDEEYVKGLRDEAATHRVKAKRADDAEERLRATAIAHNTYGILTDPTDLVWSDDFAGEDGWPDPEKITNAAMNLVLNKPHLGRPRGFVGQGHHSDEADALSLTSILRAGA